MSLAASHSTTDVSETGVFGQVMGIVAAALGLLTVGAYLGRHLSGGVSIVCFIFGFVCIFGLNYVREADGGATALLGAAGLFLGLGLGGTLDAYASVNPDVLWQSAAATALFVAGLGSIGYMISSDLSGAYRVLFLLLLALILFGFVSLFVSMAGGNVIYALLGLGIFGGYVVVDFNRLRRTDADGAVPIAAGIFLDISMCSRSSFSCSAVGTAKRSRADILSPGG